MQYRREIDGLRAVAVLPVILFHAGFSVFSGGYVGVDVFFVISGYLITSILISELEQGNLSILRFYERRARRILPALFVVMLACLPFAYMWMLPSQLEDFAQSLVAVVFFGSNILFWRESGYFGAAAELKPLLHTWSLAVEEQYYLIFPIFLLLAWRFGRNKVFWSVVAIAAFSLLLSEWGWRNSPSANFYLAPTRAWELLAGSMCAFLTVGQKQRSSNLLSALGLALILFAIFYYDENTPFPSAYTLAPVAGTALIILFADRTTWTARLLSTRGFVGIGLISYSAYLWHQPLFAFARLRSLTEPSHYLMGALAVAALLLAWATWRWVEQPFRKRANPILITQRIVFSVSGLVGVLFVAFGLAGHFGKGFPSRVSFSEAALNDLSLREMMSCFDFDHKDLVAASDWFCEVGDTNGANVTVAVIGDSHALSYFPALDAWAVREGVKLLLNGVSSCPPLINTFVRRSDARRDDCAARNAQIFMDEAVGNVDALVLIARWTYYGFGDSTENIRHIGLNYEVDADQSASYRVFKRQLSETLGTLAVAKIPTIIVHQPPVQNLDAMTVFQRAVITGTDISEVSASSSLSITEHYEAYALLQSEIDTITQEHSDASIIQIDVAPAICDPICQISRNGRAVYFDNDHLSNFGAGFVAPILIETLADVLDR